MAEEPGLTTWKTYSWGAPNPSRIPPSKPARAMALSAEAAARGLRVKRNAPLPVVRLDPAAPVKAKLALLPATGLW
jgi:hypothetical protein